MHTVPHTVHWHSAPDTRPLPQVHNTYNPIWDQHFETPALDLLRTRLRITVWDHADEDGSDEFLGEV